MDLLILDSIPLTKTYSYETWVDMYKEEIQDLFSTIRNYKSYNFLDKCKYDDFIMYCYIYSYTSKNILID